MGRRKSRVVLIKSFTPNDDDADEKLEESESKEEEKETEKIIDELFPRLDLLLMPEILENVFKYMGRRDLRACRLVRHTWNDEICRYFRKIIPVCLFDRNVIYFEKLLRGNARLRLPLPFSKYQLSIRKLDNRNLARILNSNPQPIVTSCVFAVSQTASNSNYQKKLISMLEKNAQSLQVLVFNMFRGIYLGYIPLFDELPTLPCLEKIGIHTKARSTMIPQESVKFIVDVINASPSLRELELTCDQEDVLVEIVNNSYFGSLESFYSEGLTHRQLTALANTKIPHLTKLTLKYKDTFIMEEDEEEETPLNHPETFQRLANNFGTTLEEMNISWVGSRHGLNNNNIFPYCPRLKILTLYLYEGPLAAINPICLPVLEQFILVEYTQFQGADADPVPHGRVQTFGIEDFSGLYLDDEFEILINFVDKQFPKLTSLSICMKLNDANIRTIVTALPLLDKLHVKTGPMMTDEAFTGIPLGVNVDELLKAGQDLKDIRVFPSFANMQYMIELDVSNFPTGPLITNTAIKYGLAIMPSLESLTMNWDSGFSEDIIVESLSHLRCLRLNLFNWHQVNPDRSIFYLKKVMPQLHIPGYMD